MRTLADNGIDAGAQGLAGAGERTVMVRLAIPGGAFAGILYPSSNRVGTRLLSELVAVRMQAAGAGVLRHAGAGALNEAILMFGVVSLASALRTVREVLEEVGLLAFSKIAWHDPAELVNRGYYPEGTRFDMPTSEQIQAMDDVCRLALWAFDQVQKGAM